MAEIFDRVVCGVDRSEAGEAAARIAATVAAPSGSLTLAAVGDASIAVHAGRQMAAVAEELKGVRALGSVSKRVAHGGRSSVFVVRDPKREEKAR